MKTGTPGFIGSKLREARLARGYTAIVLANEIGVTRSAISHYERGEQSPRPEVMLRISRALNLPVHYFWRIPTAPRSRKLFFRSMSSATKAARLRAESRYIWLEDIVRYLQEFVNFPPVHFPNFNLPAKPSQISPELIEEAALSTRRFWNLGNGAITNVVWLLEHKGAVITRTRLEANTLDAFSEWRHEQGLPYIILGADKEVAARSRFDVAHELGHLVLHRHIDAVCIRRKTDHSLIERQADRFAGAFLLPEQSFINEFFSPSLDTFRTLKSKWGVSIQLMIHRAQDLQLVSSDQAKRLWINCTRRGWRLTEPLDDVLPIEEPRLLRRSFEMLINEAIVNRSDILSALPYSPSDIEDLASLPAGYLDESAAPVVLREFRNRVHRKPEPATASKDEDVVVAFRPRKKNETAHLELDRKRM